MKTIKSQFRLRGFICPSCRNETQVFGHEDAPIACPHCGHNFINKGADYDQLVTTVKSIEAYKG